MEFPHSNVLSSLKLPLFSWGNFPCAGACIWGVRQREGAGKKLYLNRNGHGNLEGVHREPDWKGSGEEKLVIWFVGKTSTIRWEKKKLMLLPRGNEKEEKNTKGEEPTCGNGRKKFFEFHCGFLFFPTISHLRMTAGVEQEEEKEDERALLYCISPLVLRKERKI